MHKGYCVVAVETCEGYANVVCMFSYVCDEIVENEEIEDFEFSAILGAPHMLRRKAPAVTVVYKLSIVSLPLFRGDVARVVLCAARVREFSAKM